MRCQVVTIKHLGFPDGSWYLRLPEQISTDKDAKTGPYQVGMKWTRTTHGWEFTEAPIVGLKGTVKATVSSTIADTIDFAISVQNQSQAVWKRGLAWLCFNHSRAMKYYRYRNFVCGDSGVVTTPPKAMEHYCLPGHDRDWWTRGHIDPTAPLIGTNCIAAESGEPFCVAIAAERAIMIGQNPGWPCTDMGLLFGDVSPGNRPAVKGKIYFRKGRPEEILESYRQDFG